MYLTPITKDTSIRISEPSMMEYFGCVPEFSVAKLRHMEHQHFQMVQVFIRNAKTDADIMLINRLTLGEDDETGDLAMFQMDHEGNIDDLAREHLADDGDHFAPEFKAVYQEKGEEGFTVRYRMVETGEFHGITDKDDDGPPISQAVYETEDDDNFYLALVEWENDWLTVWFGKELRSDHISFI